MRIQLVLTLLVSGCSLGGSGGKVFEAEVSAGSCLGSPARPGPPDAEVAADSGEPYLAHPHLEAVAMGSVVRLDLMDATINCCPSPGATWTVSEDTYEVAVESVTLESACGCECVKNLSVEIPDVPAGTWTFDVSLDGDRFGSAVIEVGDL